MTAQVNPASAENLAAVGSAGWILTAKDLSNKH
jgi:hypothetical protein